ncbi:MAG: protein phosphatase 2C domain-containing protein [Tannerellaceae bacterium]|nr:protein phosphatase 2C domain-containing protein [Tannerellaceae bacterium]
MTITISKPCAISEKGGRQHNEDFIFPSPEAIDSDPNLFLICDGVGGAEKGEVASALACELFETYFSTFLEGEPHAKFINKAIQYTQAHFCSYVEAHPEAKGMATTLAMLYFSPKGATLAHVGDSRIYHIRNGKILCRTEDHSLVNSLVQLGKITPEEALTHPQRNVITRAIQGTGDPAEADVTVISDIQPGDYFFMCTDGVLENVSERHLCSVFSTSASSEIIKDQLMDLCLDHTKDNFSFYIIPIQNVTDLIRLKQNILSFFYSLA